jgi:hypothetical protein
VPTGATVLVVSKGDNQLLELGNRRAWHFPRSEDGSAGYYPADSDSAIVHLEKLRAKGAEYLLFPISAFWWLEHYTGFAAHLKLHYRVVAEEESLLVFKLRDS